MKIRYLFTSIAVVSVFAMACTEVGYYGQSVGGHMSMMSRRQPIRDIIADPRSSPDLKRELALVLEIRSFAERDLHMPVGNSFSTYADVKRPFVVWNVVAAPRYSLAPMEWCFPVAGCLNYRGYFSRDAAERFADSLRSRELDVHVYGVPAYSTLGWFDDPVLNTFVHYPEWALAGLIFHEMAHQMVYAADDGDFNEAFATTVEIEGTLLWLATRRSEREKLDFLQHQAREDSFYDLVGSTRRQLLDCYDGRAGMAAEQMQSCKDSAFARMRERYHDLKESWGGFPAFDRWFAMNMNNARFISARTYRHYVPAFRELLRQNEGDLPSFYAAVKRLSEQPRPARHLALSELLEDSRGAESAGLKADIPPAGSPDAKSGI